MAEGYIKLYRKLQEHEIWKEETFTKGQAWVDIILRANHKDGKIIDGMSIIDIERGAFITSIKSLSASWKWSRHRVSNFLNLLERMGMICQKRDTKKTYVKVRQYSDWQDSDNETGHQRDINGTSKGHQRDTNKNVKNVKNVKKKEFVAPKVDEVIEYFIEKGYTREAGQKAFEYYNTNNWHDSKNNPVRNWKQKMISIWFKDENKQVSSKQNANTHLRSGHEILAERKNRKAK